MFQLIRYDILNGKRKIHKDIEETVFNSQAEMDQFREKLKTEYPDCEVFLTFKTLKNESTHN